MKRVLLVDDERGIRETFSIFLQRAGFHALLAEDMPKARELLGKEQVDVVVADIVLPGGDGLDILREVKRLGLECPVVMITGQPTIDSATEALRQGAFDYLLKPVKKDPLLRVVGKALEYRELIENKRALEQENARYRMHLEELVNERTAQLTSLLDEHLETEKILRSQQERLSLAMEISAAAEFEIRPQEGMVICGPRLAELTGYSLAELIRFLAEQERWFDRVHPEDREQVCEQVRACRAPETDNADLSFRLQREDGVWRHLRLLARVMERDAQSRPLRLVGVTTDITARRNAELALQRTHADLERRVRERTAELHRASEQLRRLAARQDDLLEREHKRISREIHDELGQNLTALNIGLTMLERLGAPEAAQSRIQELRKGVERMLTTVQRITQELRPTHLDDLGLAAALDWQVREFRKTTGIDISLQLEPRDFKVDSEQAIAVYRLVQEALTNVARHAKARRVTLQLLAEAGMLEVVVRDDGLGISLEALHGPDAFGIMGMRERVHALGGELEIHGAPGKGTRILARFPLVLHNNYRT
jgi:two-component system, NarL family, sensor histidine kinase UhpB